MNPRQHLPPQERLSDHDREYANTAAEVIRKARTSLATAKDEIELRKWCIQQAVELYKDTAGGEHALKAAEMILNFVRAPINDALDKIEQEMR